VWPATRSVADAKCGWNVLAFLGLVISLICLLLGRIYRPFLISILCNLFYDFAACLFMSCCYMICQTFIHFTKVSICSGMAYGTSSMGSWDLVCRMGCAGYTYLYSDNIYICYSFIGLYAKDYIFTLCLFSKYCKYRIFILYSKRKI